jgi:hypothetical protein
MLLRRDSNLTAAAVVQRTNREILEKFTRSKQLLTGDTYANNYVQYQEI